MMAAQQLRPALVQPLREILDSGGFGQLIDYAMATVAEAPRWDETTWFNIGPDMTAPPFSDTGSERVIKFAALGLRWNVRCRNERRDVLATEAFTAAVQVLLVELAVQDPLFLPGDIDIEVRLREPGRPELPVFEARPPDGSCSRRWLVHTLATASEDVQQAHTQLLSTLVEILIAHSLLPAEKFMGMLENAFKAGLTHKLEVGRPYQELADLHGADYRSPAQNIRAEPLWHNASFSIPCAPELESPTRPGPGYTREVALKAVRTRYERLPPLLRYTLPRLLADTRARSVFVELRSEGWKDWHLLNALANLAVNARVASKHGTPTWGTMNVHKDQFLVEMNRPEESNDVSVSIEAVTRTALEDALNLSAISTLRNWELEIHQSTLDPVAALKVLSDRYGYWHDDVDHEEFFPSK